MKRPELEITNGELSGRRFQVKEGGLRLGRSSSNDIHIPDEELSRNHCLFETSGEAGLRVTDLASANGTLVNGKPLANDPAELHVGDLVEVGSTVIRVVGDDPEPASVDLGLGAPTGAQPARKRRSPLVNVLWAVAVALALVLICLVLFLPRGEEKVVPVAAVDEPPKVVEVRYEKVEANSEGIFRYEMFVTADGLIGVRLDDTKENRHPSVRPRPLGDRAKASLNEILDHGELQKLDAEYVGADPDVPSLSSWRLKVVYDSDVRSVSVVNAQEPDAFRAIREKLEAFSNNELGINALQYSRDKLIALAEEAIAVGRAKWEDRDVQYGNLHGAIVAFREAISDLDTLDPKPACIAEARQGLDDAQKELGRRYQDQRFNADRAINLGNWEDARRELGILLEMVPDRNDDRNREASAKLLDVEKRMKGGK